MMTKSATCRSATWGRAAHVLAGLLLAFAGWPAFAQASGTAIDWPALTLLDGRAFEPPAKSGKAAIVVFWATYCPFCKRHNAHVEKLYRVLGKEPVVLLGAALDEDATTVRGYMASNGYTFPVVLGSERLRPRFTQRRVIPTTCVVDPKGRLQQCIPGEMFEEDVLELVAQARRSAL